MLENRARAVVGVGGEVDEDSGDVRLNVGEERGPRGHHASRHARDAGRIQPGAVPPVLKSRRCCRVASVLRSSSRAGVPVLVRLRPSRMAHADLCSTVSLQPRCTPRTCRALVGEKCGHFGVVVVVIVVVIVVVSNSVRLLYYHYYYYYGTG